MNYKRIKAIIFDADGMIVHGERFSVRLENEYNISTNYTSNFFNHSFQKCLIGKADLKEELLKYIDSWGWQGDVESLLNFWFDPKHNEIDLRLRLICQNLRERGIQVYLATNNEKYRTANLIQERGLKDWFNNVFSSSDVGFKKPDAQFFQHILNQISCRKEEILFCDDDSKNIAGALDFGLQTEIYKDFEQFEKVVSQLLYS